MKNEPNSIASEPMNRNIPRIVGSSRELRFADRRTVMLVPVRTRRAPCALMPPLGIGSRSYVRLLLQTAPPARIACRAPGTPYSYGPPTTCGISSKLKTGGGDETCHSSVIARHGFDSAIGPRAQLTITL